MVCITLKPKLAKLLIANRETTSQDSLDFLEDKVQKGEWSNVPPIWVTPNFIINGIINLTLKPLIMYNGHNRLSKAIEHSLPIKIYIRYTPFNPQMSKEERLLPEIYY